MEEFWETSQSASRWISRLRNCPSVHKRELVATEENFYGNHNWIVSSVDQLDFTQMFGRSGLFGSSVHTGKGRARCEELQATWRGPWKLEAANWEELWQTGEHQSDRNFRGSVQRLAGLTLSSESPAHVSVWRVCGKVNLRGEFPPFSHHLCWTLTFLLGVWNFGTSQAEVLTRPAFSETLDAECLLSSPLVDYFIAISRTLCWVSSYLRESLNSGVPWGPLTQTNKVAFPQRSVSKLRTSPLFQRNSREWRLTWKKKILSFPLSPARPMLFLNWHLWRWCQLPYHPYLPFWRSGWRFKHILFLLRVAIGESWTRIFSWCSIHEHIPGLLDWKAGDLEHSQGFPLLTSFLLQLLDSPKWGRIYKIKGIELEMSLINFSIRNV